MKYYKIILLVLLATLLFLSISKAVGKVEAQTIEPVQAPTVTAIDSNTLFNRIASCESQNNAHAKSKTSSASGRFQFIWGTWNHYGVELWGTEFYEKNIWDYNDNTELAWYVFNKYGTSDWNASKSCWSMI